MNWRRGLFRLWIVGAAPFVIATAFAQSKDVAYYCVGDVAGGVSYNDKTKKWEATAFRPHQKFVLKMKFLGVRKEEQLSDYKVTVTETKEEDWRRALEMEPYEGLPCRGEDRNETVTVSDRFTTVSCSTGAYDYQFNLGTYRFLATYPYGYTDGRDNNDNTPSVEVGRCTKID